MKSSDRVLARRYALALYQSAVEHKEEERLAREFTDAARALTDRMAAYQHPRLSVEIKKDNLRKQLGGKASKLALRFLELLIEKKRFDLLPLIAADFSRIYDEGHGIAHATIRAASELSEKDQEALKKRLEKFLGKKVVLGVKLDADLLAGVVVRMGDWVFDASLKGGLRRLRSRMASR